MSRKSFIKKTPDYTRPVTTNVSVDDPTQDHSFTTSLLLLLGVLYGKDTPGNVGWGVDLFLQEDTEGDLILFRPD